MNKPELLHSGLSSYNSASLKWASVDDVDSYNVYRSESLDGIYAKINVDAITVLNYTDEGLDLAKTYYYKVTAVKGGNKSKKSESSFVTTPAKVGQGDWKLA